MQFYLNGYKTGDPLIAPRSGRRLASAWSP